MRQYVGGFLVGVAVVVGLSVLAQSPPVTPPPKVSATTPVVPPVLSEVDRLKVISASQQVEIWQLRLQGTASELQKAQAEFTRIVQAVTPEGWQLNEKLEFVKKDGK